MSDGTTAVTEPYYAVRVSDRDGLVMQVGRNGIWVPPDIPTDECARRVLDALSPMIRDIIEAEMGRLTSERDEAQAEVEQLCRDLTAADGTIDGLRTELAQQDHDLKTAREDVLRLTSERDATQAEAERLRGETQRAVEAEREACASLFDGPVWAYDYREIGARIRARRGESR